VPTTISSRLYVLFVYIFFWHLFPSKPRSSTCCMHFFFSHSCYLSRPSGDTVNVCYFSLCSVLHPSATLFILGPRVVKHSRELQLLIGRCFHSVHISIRSCMHIYIYTIIHTCVHLYIYIYGHLYEDVCYVYIYTYIYSCTLRQVLLE
jgi:hypothetical protein